jgi:2-polyprenyl-6-methoxyphenol hydroxylase-like FAD-dependent oxidoreductase
LNSGLGDVHNLAYKLAALHQGWAGDALLDTYESDRRQVALVNSHQSVQNGLKIFGLLKALGTTDDNVEVARQNLHRNLDDPKAMIEI